MHTKSIARLFFLALTVAVLAVTASAQSTSATGAFTPSALSKGVSPTGSYDRGSFDNISLYNGNASISLPLVQFSGRAGMSTAVVLSYNSKLWQTKTETFPNVPTQGQTTFANYLDFDEWDTKPRLAPGWRITVGSLMARRSGWGPVTCPALPTQLRNGHTLTLLTFTAPDGTEYELRDVNPTTGSVGEPAEYGSVPCDSPNGMIRGTVWKTVDGTSAIFVSESVIQDYRGDLSMATPIVVTGIMTLRDGTRFRVVNGNVVWQMDRNGNKIVFQYDLNQRLEKVTDTLGREVMISYTGLPAGVLARLTYLGFGGGGNTRTIDITGGALGGALRSDQQLRTMNQLFGDPVFGMNHGFSVSDQTFNPNVLTGIVLPSGHTWTFEYNSYGEVARVETPAGGAVEYDTQIGGGVFGNVDFNIYEFWRATSQRRVYPDGVNLEGYATYVTPFENTFATEKHFSATGTLLEYVDRHFGGSPNGSMAPNYGVPINTGYKSRLEGKEYKTVYRNAAGSALRTIEKTWTNYAPVSWTLYTTDVNTENNPQLREVKTTLETGQVSRVEYDYDQYSNATAERYYDFDGTLVRSVARTFKGAPWSNSANNMVSLVATETISGKQPDGSYVAEATTTFGYDDYSSGGLAAPLTPRAFAATDPRGSTSDIGVGIDYNSTGTTIRGNLTSATKSGAGTVPATSYTRYDTGGNPVQVIDPLATAPTLPVHSLEIDYDTLHFAFPTETTLHARQDGSPLPLVSMKTFDVSTGALTSETGYNGDVYSYQYDDPYLLDRLTQESRPGDTGLGGLGVTSVTYSPPGTYPLWIQTVTSLDSGRSVTSRQYFDGLYRPIRGENLSDPGGTVITETRFDGMGRVRLSSNPYRGSPSPTDGWTRTKYDLLGRVVEAASFDNGPNFPPTDAETPDTGAVTSVYQGNATTVTDQSGATRRSYTDGIGRLTSVVEDPSEVNYTGLNYSTTYGYDGRGNLLKVTQGGQIRTFVYDAFSRLTSATLPECGTMTYTYDVASNLLTKTDARGAGFRITYEYDELNRVLTKYYANTGSPMSPDVKYIYDGSALPAGVPAPPFTRANTVGRLFATVAFAATETSQSQTGSFMSYDDAGRVIDYSQLTDGQHYRTTNELNFASGITKQTYPSGAFISNGFNAGGQLLTVSKTNGATVTPLSSAVTYSPAGGVLTEQLGGSPNFTYHRTVGYNSRLQVASISLGTAAGSANVLGLGFTYGKQQDAALGAGGTILGAQNNGNLARQTISVGSGTPTEQDYGYDTLNRLTLAKEYYESGGGGCNAAPAAPSALAGTAASSTQINLTWNDNQGTGANAETSFLLERSANGGGSWSTVSSTIAANAVSYSDTTVAASTTYVYRISAVNGCNPSATAQSASITTPPSGGGGLNAPTGLTATTASSTQINLAWSDTNTTETGYRIERKTGAGAYTEIATVGQDATSYLSKTLTPSTTYTYRVRAYITPSTYSAYSSEASATTGSDPSDAALFFGNTNSTTYAPAASDTASTSVTGSITVEAWVRLAAIGPNNQAIVSKRKDQAGTSSSGFGGYELRVNGSGKVVFATYANNGSLIAQYVSTGLTVAAGGWHHVSGSYDGTTMRVSYDGAIESSSVGSNKGPVDGTTKLQVGRTLDGGGGKNWLSGKIDEVRISSIARYTSTFPPAQSFTVDGTTKAYWKCNENAGTTTADGSGNANTLSLTGVTWGTGVSTGTKTDEGEPVVDFFESPFMEDAPRSNGNDYADFGGADKLDAATTHSWTQEFTYDRWGNRTWGAGTTASAKGPDVTVSTASNRLTTVAGFTAVYDAAGNMTSDASGRTLSYDAENRMYKAVIGSTTTFYVYDGNGRRVKKTVGSTVTRFVYNAGGSMIAEYTTSATVPSKEFVYGPMGLLATTEGATGAIVKYPVADHLGTPRLWVNKSGSVVSRHDYFPFGDEIFVPASGPGFGGRLATQGYTSAAQSDAQRNQFTSKERDAETGLDFFQARHVSCPQGRFTSCDPIVRSGRHIANPQRWNLYTYVLNSPVGLVDPSGRQDSGSAGGKIIDVFLIDATPNTHGNKPDAAPDWKSIEGEKNGFTVKIHEAANSSFADVKSSLEAGHISVFATHGVGDTGKSPFVAVGFQLGDRSQLQNDGTTVVPGIVAEEVPGQPVVSWDRIPSPANTSPLTALFGCNTSNAFPSANPASPATILVGNTGGSDGETSTGTSANAAFAFVKTFVETGGQLDPAIAASQKVVSASDIAMDQNGDTIVRGGGFPSPPASVPK